MDFINQNESNNGTLASVSSSSVSLTESDERELADVLHRADSSANSSADMRVNSTSSDWSLTDVQVESIEKIKEISTAAYFFYKKKIFFLNKLQKKVQDTVMTTSIDEFKKTLQDQVQMEMDKWEDLKQEVQSNNN